MLRVEEYGKEKEKAIVMLHGAYFVHTYGRQYSLAKRYHLIVPPIFYKKFNELICKTY